LALDSKQEFRRSAICSISATIGIDGRFLMFISDQCSLAGKAVRSGVWLELKVA
jgi:hypothetical protein